MKDTCLIYESKITPISHMKAIKFPILCPHAWEVATGNPQVARHIKPSWPLPLGPVLRGQGQGPVLPQDDHHEDHGAVTGGPGGPLLGAGGLQSESTGPQGE